MWLAIVQTTCPPQTSEMDTVGKVFIALHWSPDLSRNHHLDLDLALLTLAYGVSRDCYTPRLNHQGAHLNSAFQVFVRNVRTAQSTQASTVSPHLAALYDFVFPIILAPSQ